MKTSLNQSIFLQAFEGTNTRVPVWFMRQAGRYLAEYQAIKHKYPLDEMFKTPELAAEITCQPIDLVGVDAAILFADILTMPGQMGFDIHFDNKKGPIIQESHDFSKAHDFTDLSHVAKTISLVKSRLPEDIPLIGFAGSPFTVLTYLVEGGSSHTYKETFKFIQEQSEAFHRLMELLTINTIDYLNLQKEAGINVFQLFGSWDGILRAEDYEALVLPYVQKIFSKVDLPSIHFLKNTHHLINLMDKSGADFLSVDHTVNIALNDTLKRTDCGIQGNLFNGLLYADDETLKREVNSILTAAKKHKRFIFNLSHGVLPNVDVNKLKLVVKEVHNFNWA